MLDLLRALCLKSGVSLGGLKDAERSLALAVPARRLGADAVVDETTANALLKAALADEAAFIATDHVELRRWLVDAGWWQRDGYGRAYRRVAPDDLAEPLRAIDSSLAGLDLPRWVADVREAARQQREQRRRAWDAARDGRAGD